MASMEVERVSGSAQDGGSNEERMEIKNEETKNKEKKKKKKKKKNGKSSYMPKFSCLRIESDGKGNIDMEAETIEGDRPSPSHLVVMVNGIIGSAQNWRYAAKQFVSKYPEDLLVHCSECNYSMLTFDGVDVMGDRLAEEVISVIKRHPGVRKISFIGHSLGGLVARFAIARLYGRDVTGELPQGNGECRNDESGDPGQEDKFKGKIAGLEPLNFITSATPHLGSSGHKQVPLFCGFYALEKVAAKTSWFLGRTGKHLFLTDCDEGKRPLLLRMVNDCEDLKFLSALQSFKRRVAYANARFDHLVGWSTSSLRHPTELPKRQHLKRGDKYPHIVNVETAKTASQLQAHLETIVDRSDTTNMEGIVNFGLKQGLLHLIWMWPGFLGVIVPVGFPLAEDVLKEMLRGLTTLSWERVDVSFSGSRQRFLAHSTIQVKTYCINSDGADVIQHMIDNFLL